MKLITIVSSITMPAIWKFSISATNRLPRDGEIDGKDYIYMSNEKFEHAIKFGDFFE